MRKCLIIFVILIIILASPVAAEGITRNGVDDLRGRWDVDLYFGDEHEGEHLQVTWLVQDIELHPEQENVFLANGCMRTNSTGGMAPLSLVATYLPEENKYDIVIYSTVIPFEGEPFVIRFIGEVIVNGSGVTDDESQGQHRSDPGEGPWSADHHDRRRPKCGDTIDPSLQFYADVYVHQDLAPTTPHFTKLYEAYTRIVSSGMLVDTPDGETVYVSSYTDIFSPFVDFVNEFRYLSNLEGPPISGEVYSFTLLDILGNPIAGATAEDIWTGCTQGAPVNILLEETTGEDVLMSWDEVPAVGGWNPAGGVGFYQIGISPMFESATSYGASGISLIEHVIPWVPFGGFAEGSPDGNDFGNALSELDVGEYEVGIGAYAEAPFDSGGHGLECAVHDSSGFYWMKKADDTLTFTRRGSISGTVYDADGSPLSNIAVDIEEGGYGTCTDENGNYRMYGMRPGIYNVVAGRDFCGPHDYIEQKIDNVELTEGTPDVNGIDFYLILGGSITGSVVDTLANPLEGIQIVACDYDDGFCKDAFSEADGSYVISGLPSSDYRVQAGNEWYITEFYEETNDWSLATRVAVSAGGITTGIGFTLEEGGSITGTVTDTIGNPLEGLQVIACEYDNGFCMDAYSEADGSYMISGLPPSDYRVQSGSEWYVTEFYQDTYDHGSATRVGVTAGVTTTDIDFTLEEGGSIAGVVTSSGGTPLEGIIVIACEYDGGYCMDATTASDGTYRIYAIPVSDYRVQAHGEGFVIFFPGTVDPDSATPVTVIANLITENINFILTPD